MIPLHTGLERNGQSNQFALRSGYSVATIGSSVNRFAADHPLSKGPVRFAITSQVKTPDESAPKSASQTPAPPATCLVVQCHCLRPLEEGSLQGSLLASLVRAGKVVALSGFRVSTLGEWSARAGGLLFRELVRGAEVDVLSSGVA
jgi:hypothetical protein